MDKPTITDFTMGDGLPRENRRLRRTMMEHAARIEELALTMLTPNAYTARFNDIAVSIRENRFTLYHKEPTP